MRAYRLKINFSQRTLTFIGQGLLLLCLAFIVPSLPSQAAADEGKDNLLRILQDIKQLQGRFKQFEYDERGRPLRVLEGDFKLADNIKLRWQVQPPYAQTIISNGTHILIYDEDLRQLLIRPLDTERLPPFFFLANNPQLLDKLAVSQPDPEQLVFILADESVEILAEFEDELPAEISWSNELNQRITIQFERVRKNRRIRNSEFEFTPPADTNIITDD